MCECNKLVTALVVVHQEPPTKRRLLVFTACDSGAEARAFASLPILVGAWSLISSSSNRHHKVCSRSPLDNL